MYFLYSASEAEEHIKPKVSTDGSLLAVNAVNKKKVYSLTGILNWQVV